MNRVGALQSCLCCIGPYAVFRSGSLANHVRRESLAQRHSVACIDMAMRIREAPSGGVRVSYAILVAVLSGLGGLLIVAIANPVFTNAGVCVSDQTLYCGLAVSMLAWIVGSWLIMVWLTHMLRLGWEFLVITITGQLLVIELVFQTDSFWWLLAYLVVPIAASILSDPGHKRDSLPRRRSLAILVVGVVVFIEFLVWGWFCVLAVS